MRKIVKQAGEVLSTANQHVSCSMFRHHGIPQPIHSFVGGCKFQRCFRRAQHLTAPLAATAKIRENEVKDARIDIMTMTHASKY